MRGLSSFSNWKSYQIILSPFGARSHYWVDAAHVAWNRRRTRFITLRQFTMAARSTAFRADRFPRLSPISFAPFIPVFRPRSPPRSVRLWLSSVRSNYLAPRRCLSLRYGLLHAELHYVRLHVTLTSEIQLAIDRKMDILKKKTVTSTLGLFNIPRPLCSIRYSRSNNEKNEVSSFFRSKVMKGCRNFKSSP